MHKQINLIINGKGGVGKSFFATNFVQYLKDSGIAHCAINSDHENSTLKRFHPESEFINLERRREIDRVFTALNGVPFRKDIELLRCDFRFAASHCEAQRLCSPFRRCSHRALFPWLPLPPSPGFGVPSRTACAVRHSTTRDHCGALKRLSRTSLDPVGHHIAVTDPAYGFALGDCACPLSRTDSEFGLWGM
jgi:CobQ/CobB/MinD/ParA nucleotide binding domain